MSRVIFSLTEAQYLALCQAHEGKSSNGRTWSTARQLERRGFLRTNHARGYHYFELLPAGMAIIALGQALQAFEQSRPRPVASTNEGESNVRPE